MPTQLSLLDRDWCDRCVDMLCVVTNPGQQFTSDDLHKVFTTVPPHSNWWGILVAKLRHSQCFEKVGYRPSARPEANGRVVAVWRRKA